MRKNVLMVMWLALAALFTVSALSACSDDDNNETGNGGGVTIDGVDQAEYFRQNLGLFTETDSLGCSFLKVLDELTPTVFTYFVDDEKMAETLFLAWIPEQAQASVVRDGSTIVYTPRDAQGAPQGTIIFRKALPTETATLAVVELKGVSKIKGMDKIKFQPESARPDNGDVVPKSTHMNTVLYGDWFLGTVQKDYVYKFYHEASKTWYFYTIPKPMKGKDFLEKIGNNYYSDYGYECLIYGAAYDEKFENALKNIFKSENNQKVNVIVSGSYGGASQKTFIAINITVNFGKLRIARFGSKQISINESETYFVCQGYKFMHGRAMSY